MTNTGGCPYPLIRRRKWRKDSNKINLQKMAKMFKVTNLRTGREYTKTEEEVNELKASPVFVPGNYSIVEIKGAEMPKEVRDKIGDGSEKS